jgi:hypothetical protein
LVVASSPAAPLVVISCRSFWCHFLPVLLVSFFASPFVVIPQRSGGCCHSAAQRRNLLLMFGAAILYSPNRVISTEADHSFTVSSAVEKSASLSTSSNRHKS